MMHFIKFYKGFNVNEAVSKIFFSQTSLSLRMAYSNGRQGRKVRKANFKQKINS